MTISCVFFFFFGLQTPPAGNKSQYEEIDIPVALLSYSDMLDISKVGGQTLALTESHLLPNSIMVLKKKIFLRTRLVVRDGQFPLTLTWLCGFFLQTFGKGRLVAMYAPNEPVLDYNMVIIFLMAVGTVAVGGYWAGSRDRKKQVAMIITASRVSPRYRWGNKWLIVVGHLNTVSISTFVFFFSY